MQYRNIYKIDDFLILFGFATILVIWLPGLLLLATAWPNTGSRSLEAAGLSLAGCLLIAGPVVMIALGLGVRSKEKKVNRLIHLLEMSPDCEIPALVKETRLSPEQVKTSLLQIDRLGIARYEWDETLGRVYDRRLLGQFVFVHSCPSCGGSVGKQYSLILPRVPACDYCGKPYDPKFWNELRFAVMNSIVKNNLDLYKIELQQRGRDINIPVAIALFMVFWPAGVWYLLSRRRN